MSVKTIIKKGDKYGRLTILKEAEPYITPKGKKERKILCECECGIIKSIKLSFLKNGHTKSCGCLAKEQASINGKTTTTHGMHKTKIYYVWSSMKARCDNPKHKAYKDYGWRGITYDKKRETFEGFYKDMGDSYKEGLTLERRKNNLGYSKNNCKRATRVEQNNNQRSTTKYTYNGKTQSIKKRAIEYGIPYTTLRGRINVHGLTIQQSLSRGNSKKHFKNNI